MIPLISVAILAGVVGLIGVLLYDKIINLRRDLNRTLNLIIDGNDLMQTRQRRIVDFLDQWIPQVEEQQYGRHIHWMVDRSAGPNWYIYECRCRKTEEGEL